ncbi:MAG: hypothetical protein LW650_10995 [Planctomycetaceae bacterium]|jgi:hypothetical protein|nr:hypothetical protein [Phycisphaerales bacterium]MCE2653971.1 hypothetical protein [Planctomycetaceae bacterium]
MKSNQLTLSAAVLCAMAGAAYAVPYPETEPNNSKATANTINGVGGVGILPGDSITGTSTGTSTTATATLTSGDNFRVKMAAAGTPGIYRNRLVINALSGLPGNVGTLRGLTQSATTGINVTSDATVQTSSTATNPARMNQWYSFGGAHEIIYRVTGVTTSTEAYEAVLEQEAVTPTAIPGALLPGDITIARNSTHRNALDLLIYDGNFQPVTDGALEMSATVTSVTRNLSPGTYYIAVSNVNTANDQPAPFDSGVRTGNVMDFPGVVANSSTTTLADTSLAITGPNGTLIALGANDEAFKVNFYRLTVATAADSFGPQGTVTFTGVPFVGQTFSINLTTFPGQNPASTGITVSCDVATFTQTGPNTWTATPTLASPGGPVSGTITISDAQGRSSQLPLQYAVRDFVDLGTVSLGTPITAASRSFSSNEVLWYRFTLANDITNPCSYLDIHNRGSVSGTGTDVELGLYRADGTFVDSSDDWNGVGPSMLTFGRTSPTRLYNTPGTFNWTVGANGTDGPLPAGTYYIAMGAWNVNFNASNFDVEATSANAGTMEVSILSGLSSEPAIQMGAINAGTVSRNAPLATGPYTTLLTAVVRGACTPASTNLACRVDLSTVGGSATAQMFDDGTNGDATANDGVFSLRYTIPDSVSSDTYTLAVSASDGQGRTATGSASLVVREAVTNLGTITGPEPVVSTDRAITRANEVVWYRFTLPGPVADPANYLDISMLGSTAVDLEIALFGADGTFIVTDDDGGPGVLSQLSFGNVGPRAADPTGDVFAGQDGSLVAGEYFLAVCSFNATFGTPFAVNTPGANLAPTLSITLRTDLPGGGPAGCNVADITGIGGPPASPDGLLTGDDFNAFISAFASSDLLADITGIGGPPATPDGLITGDDFNAFIAAFAAGCP